MFVSVMICGFGLLILRFLLGRLAFQFSLLLYFSNEFMVVLID